MLSNLKPYLWPYGIASSARWSIRSSTGGTFDVLRNQAIRRGYRYNLAIRSGLYDVGSDTTTGGSRCRQRLFYSVYSRLK